MICLGRKGESTIGLGEDSIEKERFEQLICKQMQKMYFNESEIPDEPEKTSSVPEAMKIEGIAGSEIEVEKRTPFHLNIPFFLEGEMEELMKEMGIPGNKLQDQSGASAHAKPKRKGILKLKIVPKKKEENPGKNYDSSVKARVSDIVKRIKQNPVITEEIENELLQVCEQLDMTTRMNFLQNIQFLVNTSAQQAQKSTGSAPGANQPIQRNQIQNNPAPNAVNPMTHKMDQSKSQSIPNPSRPAGYANPLPSSFPKSLGGVLPSNTPASVTTNNLGSNSTFPFYWMH